MEIKRVAGINAFCVSGTMDKVEKFFRDVLGAKMGPEMSWRAQFGMRAKGAWLGTEVPFRLELSESINDELPAGKQHKRSAPAFQVLGLEVENIDEATAELRAKGIRVSDKIKTEDPAFEKQYQSWIHPKDAFGLIIELVECRGKMPPDGEW